MAFVEASRWDAIDAARVESAERAIPKTPRWRLPARLKPSRLTAWTLTLCIHAVGLWLLLVWANGGVPIRDRVETALKIFALGSMSDADEPAAPDPPALSAGSLAKAQTVTAPAVAPPLEWSLSKIMVASQSSASPSPAPGGGGSSQGRGSAGAYDPYAGASPQRREDNPASGGVPDPRTLDMVRNSLRDSTRSGAAGFEIRFLVRADGRVADVSLTPRDENALSILRALVVGKPLYLNGHQCNCETWERVRVEGSV